MDSVKLNDLIKEFHLEIIRGFDMIDTTELFIPDITRPGLQLAGHYMHFGPDRIQLIGNMEIAYLKSLTEDERRHKYNTLFSTGIPCLIINGRTASQAASTLSGYLLISPVIPLNPLN